MGSAATGHAELRHRAGRIGDDSAAASAAGLIERLRFDLNGVVYFVQICVGDPAKGEIGID
jgi:hypothetical protein